jgi:hypothetical protein
MRRAKMIATILASNNLRYMDITQPTGWTWNLPFTIQQAGRNFRAWDATNQKLWHTHEQEPTSYDFTRYVDGVNGLDTNTGESLALAFKSLDKALSWMISQTAGTTALVYVAPGMYAYPLSPRRTATTHNWVFKPYGGSGRVVSSCHETLAWTLVDNHYEATSTNTVYAVYDAATLTANGDYTKLTSRASIAEVDANPGSYFVNATAVYVRAADSRAPDSNIRPFVNYQNWKQGQATTMWFENFDFEGGGLVGYGTYHVFSTAANPQAYAYFKDCAFKYGQANGLASQGAFTYSEDCTAAANNKDGFNYHNGNGFLPDTVEINCTGRDNGLSGNSDNGSTIHDGGSAVRLMGSYTRNIGRNIHDIGTGTLAWLLGCLSTDSRHTVSPINYGSGDGSSTTTLWLDSCTSSVSATDIECNVNCLAHLRNFSGAGSNTGSGTIDTY